MNSIKKIFALFLSCQMIVSFGNIINIEATESFEDFDSINGVPPLTIEEYNEICENIETSTESEYSTYVSYPSTVDLSTSPYFPPIDTQGSLGSCTAWATTYYQFTYEMHKLNNISSTRSNSYSPSWTWNYNNRNSNQGISVNSAYSTLKLLGAETWSEMPYNTTNYNYSWPSNEEQMMNALKSRVNYVGTLGIIGTGTAISNNSDSDLNIIKSYLCDGKVLVTTMNNRSYNDSQKHIIYRGNDTGSSAGTHSVTIVGYDDNFSYDINRNNIIEPFEKGALKIANSWGTSYGYSGYQYVMYDALNGVSASPTSWESDEEGHRKAIFNVIPTDATNTYSYNVFYYINVENRNVNYVGVLDIDTDYREKMFVSIQHKNIYGSDNYTRIFPIRIPSNSCKDLNIPFSGKLLLDYGNCYNSDDPYTYSNGNDWYIKLGSDSDDYVDYTAQSWINNNSISYAIKDAKGNIIKQFSNLSIPTTGKSRIFSQRINHLLGDVNFDNVVNVVDYATVHQYINGGTHLSNVQKRIADCDSDGDIDEQDKQYILNQYLH